MDDLTSGEERVSLAGRRVGVRVGKSGGLTDLMSAPKLIKYSSHFDDV